MGAQTNKVLKFHYGRYLVNYHKSRFLNKSSVQRKNKMTIVFTYSHATQIDT